MLSVHSTRILAAMLFFISRSLPNSDFSYTPNT